MATRPGLVGLGWMLALALSGQPAAARTGPVIAGDKATPECRTALAMAKKAFRSTQVSLDWPVATPDGTAATIVLARSSDEPIDGMRSDFTVFERIESGTAPTNTIYWQKNALGGKRIVMVDAPIGWRGDWYYLYSLSDGLAMKEFLDTIAKPAWWTGELADAFAPVLGYGNWTPPVILRDSSSHKLWAIDLGEPHFTLGNWRVLTTTPKGMSSPCRIDFTPKSKPGSVRLPAAVRRFARLANKALGPDHDMGTLHPTAAIRGKVEDDWAIVSNRPWALTDTPYNSHAEVEAGLKTWAKGIPARARVYWALHGSYGAAERALANYYTARFAVPASAARRYSAYAIDHMLRSYFVFHSDKPGDSDSKTPWPAGIR